MEEYIIIIKHEEEQCLSVCFLIEKEKPFRVGERMNELNEDAYMNGHNWAVFLNYYLKKNYPDIMDGLDPDPEAGTYVAVYSLNPANEEKAKKLKSIIEELIDNESILYEIVEKEGDQIEWD